MATIQATIKLRDNKFVVIHFRNKKWGTGIILTKPSIEFKNGKLTSKYLGEGDYNELNKNLYAKLNKINKLISDALNKDINPILHIDEALDTEKKKQNRLAITRNTSLSDAYGDWVEHKKTVKKDLVADRSMQRYESELSRIKDFEKLNPTKLKDINIEWIYNFARFLAKPYKKTFEIKDEKFEKEYVAEKTLKQSNATIKRFLLDLNSFFKSIQLSNEIKFPIEDINKFFVSLKTPDITDIVALSSEQWKEFKAYTPNPTMEWEVRTYDLFRWCCNTGLRFSDAVRMDSSYIINNSIEMKAQKTRNAFSVPMNEDAQRIFKKYNESFIGKFPQNQQINQNLRKILSKIEIFKKEDKFYEYSLNDVREVKCKSYEKFSFHSSRSSFVSFCIRNKATLDQIQRYTGWTDLRTLRKYLDVFGERNSNDNSIVNF